MDDLDASQGAPGSARGSDVAQEGAEDGPLVVPGRGRVRREALDPDAVSVVSRLQRAGHEAYLVGGCVRDLLMGLEPKDFDVATDAVPNRIRRLFRNAWIIGRRFRLAHVRFADDKVVETATFRADPGEQGQHPAGEDRPIFWDNVFGTAAEDARRRDFTVNALFYDPFRDVVVDHVGGLADVEARLVRAIGDPERRLKEDPVRMIRAVHFAARMGGSVEPALLAAIRRCAPEIAKASPARLYVELGKILTRGSARPTFRSLHDLGVLRHWLPELSAGLDAPIEWPTTPGGTHEEASRGEPEDVPASHLTWNLLGAADAFGLAAHGAPDSVALASLFGPWLLEAHRRAPRAHDLLVHVEEAFRPLALRMSVPRRVTYEMRDLLALLPRLRHPPENRSRLHSVLRRPAIDAALAYFRLDLRARDADGKAHEEWAALLEEYRAAHARRSAARRGHAATREEWPPPGEEEGAARPGGRRRRGRRGRRAPLDEPPAHDEAAPAEAPARAARPVPTESPPPPPPPEPPRRPAAPPTPGALHRFGEGIL
jgi:poly(A) polymerase